MQKYGEFINSRRSVYVDDFAAAMLGHRCILGIDFENAHAREALGGYDNDQG
jgi:hypothetical protein